MNSKGRGTSVFRGIVNIRALAACVLLIPAAGALSARPNDDSSRYVVKTDSLIEFRASATFTKWSAFFSPGKPI